ncbi:hypothetical protein JRQ81_012131 [Phrynocephalus forsythii]|uniref:Uncharacterized protein n=1 Tax=Phrynocephalus forsythii TaxID=171643 RepID=A0A9Q1APS0_9SAUR|nr:hypothetical protein JRQ81_012131 [Phrynocephalus forsythii]
MSKPAPRQQSALTPDATKTSTSTPIPIPSTQAEPRRRDRDRDTSPVRQHAPSPTTSRSRSWAAMSPRRDAMVEVHSGSPVLSTSSHSIQHNLWDRTPQGSITEHSCRASPTLGVKTEYHTSTSKMHHKTVRLPDHRDKVLVEPEPLRSPRAHQRSSRHRAYYVSDSPPRHRDHRNYTDAKSLTRHRADTRQADLNRHRPNANRPRCRWRYIRVISCSSEDNSEVDYRHRAARESRSPPPPPPKRRRAIRIADHRAEDHASADQTLNAHASTSSRMHTDRHRRLTHCVTYKTKGTRTYRLQHRSTYFSRQSLLTWKKDTQNTLHSKTIHTLP